MNREISPVLAAVAIAAVIVLIVVVGYFGIFRKPQHVAGRPVAGSGPTAGSAGMHAGSGMGAFGGSGGRPMRPGVASGGMPGGGY
jgi:hypothetical protein